MQKKRKTYLFCIQRSHFLDVRALARVPFIREPVRLPGMSTVVRLEFIGVQSTHMQCVATIAHVHLGNYKERSIAWSQVVAVAIPDKMKPVALVQPR